MVLGASAAVDAAAVNSYFGWNYVSSTIVIGGNLFNLPTLTLNSITYQGEGGTTIQNMPNFFGSGPELPDGIGLVDNPTYTTVVDGDGETTRTVGAVLSIDWIPAGILTPWGSTYGFPTIGITGIVANGGPVALSYSPAYVVGLIPEGSGNELNSALGGAQGDIYDPSRAVTFNAIDLPPPDYGYGDLIFSASAAAVPVPSAVWLFGSGLLGLVAVARRRMKV
jgi:hypothetical protein